MTNCKECGKEVSRDAKTCPHCGVSKPAKKSLFITMTVPCRGCKKDVTNRDMVCPHCGIKHPAVKMRDKIILGAIMAVIFLVIIRSCRDEPDSKIKSQVFGVCWTYITNYQNSNAEPGGSDTVGAHQKEDGNWQIGIDWRAANGFGAMAHNRTWCVVDPTGQRIISADVESLGFDKK